MELGLEWIECDLRLSKDGVPVLFHDDSIPVLVGPDRKLRDLTAAELAEIDIGGGETVPTLEQLLVGFRDTLCFDLELKELDAVDPVIDLVRKTDCIERSFITSFLPEALQHGRDVEPGLARGLLVDRLAGRIAGPKSTIRAAALLQCAYFLPHYRSLTKAWVSAAHAEGMLVIPWTVNHIEDAQKLIDLGVDGIVSDRPDQFYGIIPSY